MRRVHVVVSGMVQGVGYRYTLQIEARRSGTSGWVRNRRDGTVEAELEGTADQVDGMLAWMADGPPGARVADAQVSEIAATGRRGFEVLATE